MRSTQATHFQFHYWQLGLDPGPGYPQGWFSVNRTLRNRMLCQAAYGSSDCPLPCTQRAPATDGGQLYFATLGRLTNCIMVLELARWLAEQLGKRLVVPSCVSGENTEQACTPGSRHADHRETNLLINVTAVYDGLSVGGCNGPPHPPLSVNKAISQSTQGDADAVRALTCVGKTSVSCAWMLATSKQFSGIHLGRFVEFDLGELMDAWLKYVASTRNGAMDNLRDALQRQDDGEPCDVRPLTKNAGCGCSNGTGIPTTDKACSSHQPSPSSPRKTAHNPRPPCLRTCHGLSVFDATAGDIFVPNLFNHGDLMNVRRPQLCSPLRLSEAAAAQARELRESLPGRFLCLHWRAGDFLSPEPLSRLRGQSLAAQNRALGNSTFMARAATRAARAVDASHVLVLTNARWERVQAFSEEIARESLNATILQCTDAPPDSEKEVCADGAALLLSRKSSFSVHIHRLALARSGASPIPVEYVSGCPSPGSSTWANDKALSRSSSNTKKLLAGTPIPC
jgi:hypothetical protein